MKELRAKGLADYILTQPEVKSVKIPQKFQDDLAYDVKVNGVYYEVLRVHDSFRECYPYAVEFGKTIEEIQSLSRAEREAYLIDLTFLALKIGE